MLDLPLDWNAMTKAGATVGSGAVVVCDDRACMLDMALNSVQLLPQRVVRQVRAVPHRLGEAGRHARGVDAAASAGRAMRALIDELCHALKMTSICGLGQVVPAPIQSVLKHFRAEVEAHLAGGQLPGRRLLLGRSPAPEWPI